MKRDIQKIDDDIIRKKRIIEQALYSDEDIVEILDNPKIDNDVPEDLVYENIFPCIRIPGTQDVSKNFITFTIDDIERIPSNIMDHIYPKTMPPIRFGIKNTVLKIFEPLMSWVKA